MSYAKLFESRKSEYDKQIARLEKEGRYIKSIEDTVSEATASLAENARSFVIYGEPQSGKTEMMICLVGRLLDLNYSNIVVLVNDSVDLLNQNLERFRNSSLNPTPMGMADALTSSADFKVVESIIFCKKNSKDLEKLITRLRGVKSIVIIDDEADFATPNSKINKLEETKINELVKKLRNLGSDGVWIGVTATPARLDLNNTLENNREKWVHFAPHPDYCGHEIFFPPVNSTSVPFTLVGLADAHDQSDYIRTALIRFVVNVAHMNLGLSEIDYKNYAMIVHTSGKKDDHEEDRKVVDKFFTQISDPSNSQFEKRYGEIEKFATETHGQENIDEILNFIASNSRKNIIQVINSDSDKSSDGVKVVTNPVVPFTIAIGGNIISRGVTFNNLLTMFFTREAKTMQQDTYIQRARMFGNRKNYLDHFELHIPKSLYLDWQQAFTFHRLALASIKSGEPVWLEGSRVRAVATSSVDKLNVSIDKGEINFGLIDFKPEIASATKDSHGGYEEFKKLAALLPKDYVSVHIRDFISDQINGASDLVAWHFSGEIEKYADADYKQIQRPKGFFGKGDLELIKYPNAVHHFKFYFNKAGKARLFYKYTEKESRIRFVKWRSTS